MKTMICPHCWGGGEEPDSLITHVTCSYCKGKGSCADLQLSEHFWLSEFLSSRNAVVEQISNAPTPVVVAHTQILVKEILEPLRVKLGLPLSISSGIRMPRVNLLVRGSEAHPSGFAADMTAVGMSRKELVDYIIKQKFLFDQLIFEGTWVHVARFAPDGTRVRGETLMAFPNAQTKKMAYSTYDPNDPRIHT